MKSLLTHHGVADSSAAFGVGMTKTIEQSCPEFTGSQVSWALPILSFRRRTRRRNLSRHGRTLRLEPCSSAKNRV